MKATVTFGLLASLIVSLTVFSCNTTDLDKSFDPAPGKLRLVFDNGVGTSDLNLKTGNYKNELGEAFTITKFNYFISNIQLRNADGTTYTVPQDSSYYLVQEEKSASQIITLPNVPAGNYNRLTFTVGVDSLRSLADLSKRTGVLDPGLNDGMYWEWNSGYIFMKLEGTSALAPAAQNNAFFYHVGGFGKLKGINNLRIVTLPFKNEVATVRAGATPSVLLRVDALTIFNGSTKLSIAQYPSVMFDPYSTNISANYAQMFTVNRIDSSL